jgi:hypothetical protein
MLPLHNCKIWTANNILNVKQKLINFLMQTTKKNLFPCSKLTRAVNSLQCIAVQSTTLTGRRDLHGCVLILGNHFDPAQKYSTFGTSCFNVLLHKISILKMKITTIEKTHCFVVHFYLGYQELAWFCTVGSKNPYIFYMPKWHFPTQL